MYLMHKSKRRSGLANTLTGEFFSLSFLVIDLERLSGVGEDIDQGKETAGAAMQQARQTLAEVWLVAS